MTSTKQENHLLHNWHVKIAIVAGLVVPAITATGAFYDLKAQIVSRENVVNERISTLELQNQREFADKTTIKEMQEDIKQMHSDIVEIKTLLQKRSR